MERAVDDLPERTAPRIAERPGQSGARPRLPRIRMAQAAASSRAPHRA